METAHAGNGRRGTKARAEVAAHLARLGGRMALDCRHAPLAGSPRASAPRVSWKPDDSMVTDVDIAIQQRIEKEIRALFPDDVVIGEEGDDVPRLDPGHRHVWVIDPIDGTNNYGRGLPGFSVSIGVMRDAVPVAGAVFDPLADMLFTASVGGGAWLNGERLSVGPSAVTPRSLFAIRSPFEHGVPPHVTGWLERYRLRRFGSTALHLCYVALDGLAFVHDDRASLWDIAGAAPVVTEAGAVLTRPDGAPLFPLPGVPTRIAFLAGNPEAHASIADEIVRATVGAGR